MKKLVYFFLFSTASIANAQATDENVVFFGFGEAPSTSVAKTSDKAPFTIGYMKLSNSHDGIWGFDISGEGTMLDSTWNQKNAVKQANSFNIIAGKNIGKTEYSRTDLGAIVGFRHKSRSCPPSNLGYQCYADADPEVSYAFNYGLTLTWSYQSLLLGLRFTGESKQALVGVRF